MSNEAREARVPLGRAWGRKSAAGRTYFTGKLGQARLLIFPGADSDGTPTLDLVVVPGEPRERTAPGDAPAGAREPEAPRGRVTGDAGIPF